MERLCENPSHPSFKLPAESIQVILKYEKSLSPILSRLSVDNRVDPSRSSTFESSQDEIPYRSSKRSLQKVTWEEDSYEGIVVNGNLHGWGLYYTQRGSQRYFYDAQFYINKLEGYGEIFYENGSYFQGLFKKQLRYGPGVLTYPNGSQDVGFWNGFKLIRLTCVVGNDLVPKIANTQLGRSKLMCNRYLVQLENNNFMEEHVFPSMEEKPSKYLDQVHNIDVRNPNSLFFHKKFYDEQFFRGEECTINVVVEDGGTSTPEYIDEALFQERTTILRRKIKEVSDSWETFAALKKNLIDKVEQCRVCCKDQVSQAENTIQEEEEEEEQLNVADSVSPIAFKLVATSETPTESIFDSQLLVGRSGLIFQPVEVSQTHSNIEPVPALMSKESQVEVGPFREFTCSCEEEITDDLQYMEDQLENISRQELYYRNIRDELQKKLNKMIETEEKTNQTKFQYKKVKVNELWAWNNEETLIEMQKHCFRHRNSEDMVNFDVPSLILGERKTFGPTGEHEELCQKFLLACSKGNKNFVKKCLRQDQVHPNVTDARGNSGMFFAASKNQQNVISILTNFGGKLDQLNDEQLTPLSMTLLQYICVKNNCEDWEKAFLPSSTACKVPDLPKWYQVKSFFSMPSGSSLNSSLLDQEYAESNHRIIELFQRISNMPIKRGSLRKAASKISYIFDLNCLKLPEKRVENKEETPVNKADELLKSTYLTITTLLDYEANPNACEVPYPPLVLSLFTENADILLRAKADPKVTIEEDLTCLHIAASLPPTENNIEICQVLVKYDCDPNKKTLPTHWEDKRTTYTGPLLEIFQIQDTGKNPLHLLCMRSDFGYDTSDYFQNVAKILIDAHIDVTEKYLGHTPLSLAVLSGNIKLAKCLLKSNLFNPYEPLEYCMGNILTLYALKRFENSLSIEQVKAMLAALVELNVNVLYEVEDAENAIVFVEDFDTFLEQLDQGEKKTKKSKKKEKHSQREVIIDFLKILARQTIVKRIQLKVVQMLIMFTEEGIPLEDSDICKTLVSEFLTPAEVIKNVEIIFVTRTFGKDRLKARKLKELVAFADLHKKPVKGLIKQQKKKKGNAKDPPKEERSKYSLDTIDSLSTDLELISKRQCYVHPVYLTIPGLDDPLKYKVCFHCLRGKEKRLKVCPRCQLIYFCSLQCNKSNLKVKSQHGCNLLFYEMSDIQIEEVTKGVCLEDLVLKLEEHCEVRLNEARYARLVEQEDKLLAMWRADTYGTKFMNLMPLLEEAERKATGQYITWNVVLLKSILERSFKTDPGDISVYAIDNLLLKLKRSQRLHDLKEEEVARPRQSMRRSTIGGGSTIKSLIFQDFITRNVEDTKKDRTKGVKNAGSPKRGTEPQKPKEKTQMGKCDTEGKFPKQLKQKQQDHEGLSVLKRMRKIPSRYRRFIEIVSLYFPEVDFSFWLLPYACYSDGQMYYKFCTKFFKESYSMA
ncbi:uncharacterized protein LOC126737495 isoform X2 [Anthonomus grandis grandis]|uniref:uncharacterized protein LOC126737495 isoform X2 n=1 Tax=Anthonomus grandis grandis TaxID=2921223 RepID=UPI002166A15F|nr:uncharacterized protein LOC126737495 isoform X2 [Anthonomus grandis grandis]